MTRRLPRVAAGIAIAVLTACGGGVPASRNPAPGVSAKGAAPGRTYELSDTAVDDIVRDVSVGRQLSPTRPVSIVRLDRAAFTKQLFSDEDTPEPQGTLTANSAFLLGFDFMPAPDKRAHVATTEDVLKEQVSGFYDPARDKVFLPNIALHSEEDLLEQRAVLAHEVQHALQHQRLKVPKTSAQQTSDEALAHLALLEGDAMVAMGAALGTEAGSPVGRTLRRIVEATSRVRLSTVTRGERSTQLDHALDVTKRRLLFPYEQGMLFVSDVYRAGGFPLVDKIYDAPPSSTAQILHPEKYLANEQPRHVASPKPPPGFEVAATDTLGELDTRILLSRCLDPAVAEAAATGWAGGRFGVFVGPARELAVAWVSAWDTEQDAREMEAALAHSDGCWHDNALGLTSNDYVIGSRTRVERRGELVAFVRGIPTDAEDSVLRGLFPLVGPRVHGKPLTDLKIPPRVVLPEPKPGLLHGDVYVNEWLGLTGRVVPGMTPRIGGKDIDFMVERSDVLVRGGLAISLRVATEQQNERTFQEVQDGFALEAARVGQRAERLGGGPVDTALGAGIERTWRVVGTAVEERVVLIPICAGTGSVAFIQVYGDAYARSVLDGWVDSFRWLHGRNLVACDYLDPK